MVTGNLGAPGRRCRPWFTPPADPDAGRLEAYDYELPDELIAQEPLEPRDSSRLMVVHRGSAGAVHSMFRYLPGWLQAGDVLVINETRVIPARLLGRRKETGGQVEWLLLRPEGDDERVWRVLARPARRLRPGQWVVFSPDLEGQVLAEGAEGVRIVRLHSRLPLREALQRYGQVPLPPYIRRPLMEPERYQTIYARREGSVAAPTAGLHFTPGLLDALRLRGVQVASLTLHVGLGTFRPVEVQQVDQHQMDSEFFQIPEATAAAIAHAKSRGRRVVAVGTTVTRALESAALGQGRVRAGEGWTSLFIRPGFSFQVVQGLVTNFHLPRSTLLMLVSAFVGRRQALALYQEAVRRRYRFYSFGDAMLVI